MRADWDEPRILPEKAERLFFYDAEANLIQWVLIANKGDAVLARCIELATERILAREPNIFVATGPSVFTDAFIDHHSAKPFGRASAARGSDGAIESTSVCCLFARAPASEMQASAVRGCAGAT